MSAKVCIFGYHGQSNFGDDYFLKFILEAVSSKFGDPEISVLARRGSLVSFSKKNKTNKFIEALPKRRTFRGYDKWYMLLREGLRSNYLIFCAGSIFTIIPSRLFYIIIRMLRLFNPNLTIIAVGVSIGPFSNDRDKRFTTLALERFDHILVRDRASLEYIQGENVKFVPDIAFTHNHLDSSSGQVCESNIVGVALNPYASIFDRSNEARERNRNSRIVSALIDSAIPIDSVKLFITCSDETYGDDEVSSDFYSKAVSAGLSVSVIKYQGGISDFCSEIYSVNKMISSRLHTGFFALLGGADLFQLCYAKKIKDFYLAANLEAVRLVAPLEFSERELVSFLRGESGPKKEQDTRKLFDIRRATVLSYEKFFESLS